jgi:hypothetical protein
MEKSLTSASRVFRRMKGGRPKNLGFGNPTALDIVYRLFREIEKVRVVMKEEHLDRRRLNWKIRYYFLDEKGRPTFGYVDRPRVSDDLTTRLAINLLEQLYNIERVEPLFLAIEWDLRQAVWLEPDESEDTDLSDWDTDWETKFNAYPEKLSEITEVLAAQKLQK